ncbi:MAG: xanthine dehydrogenase family protein subunit M [Chloroflexota bacterium]
MHRFDYYTPSTVSEAVDLLRSKGDGGKVLAGGTDLMPQMKERGRHPKYLVSLKNVAELRGIGFNEGSGLTVGAGTRMRALQVEPVVQQRYNVLVQGARLIGSLQTQNLATVGGNVCNAAPSADAVPAFIVLDAQATIQGPRATRTLPLVEVFKGPGQTVLTPDELLTSLQFGPPLARSAGVYLRHVPRKELDIAVAGVGVYVQLDDAKQRITHVRVCLASVAPTPIRAPQAEAALNGQTATAELFAQAGEAASRDARPISDQRGSAAFRRTLVAALTAKALNQAVAAIRGG